MTDNPTAGPAEGQPETRDPDGMRAAAELYMIDVLELPVRLLPAELEGSALLALSVGLRRAVLRRLRIRDRLTVAAQTLAGHALAVIDMVATPRVLPGYQPSCPVSADDAARVTELAAQLRELDSRLADEAATLRGVAEATARAQARAQQYAQSLPGVDERALQRGLGVR